MKGNPGRMRIKIRRKINRWKKKMHLKVKKIFWINIKKNIKMDPIYLSNNNNFVNCIIYTVLYFE